MDMTCQLLNVYFWSVTPLSIIIFEIFSLSLVNHCVRIQFMQITSNNRHSGQLPKLTHVVHSYCELLNELLSSNL